MTSAPLIPQLPGTLLRPPHPPRYSSIAKVTDTRLGLSCERTVWPQMPLPAARQEVIFFWAAKLAARAYTSQIKKTFRGFLGPGRLDDEERSSLYIRPFGLQLLELMTFGPLRRGEACGEFYYRVDGGVLAMMTAEETKRGRLYFRWYRKGDKEVFETEVRDFTPRLGALGGPVIGTWIYKLVQMNMHRFVMWRFHVWVQRHREELLLEALKRANSPAEIPCLPEDTTIFASPHAAGRVDQRLLT